MKISRAYHANRYVLGICYYVRTSRQMTTGNVQMTCMTLLQATGACPDKYISGNGQRVCVNELMNHDKAQHGAESNVFATNRLRLMSRSEVSGSPRSVQWKVDAR